MASTLAANIKTRRQTAKLTQEELAKKAGISQSMLNQIEQDKRTPSITALEAIAGGLGTKAGYLLLDEA